MVGPKKVKPKSTVGFEPTPTVKEATVMPEPSQLETIILQAPTLPWHITTRYLAEEFRPAYTQFLKKLIKHENLRQRYIVSDCGELIPKK